MGAKVMTWFGGRVCISACFRIPPERTIKSLAVHLSVATREPLNVVLRNSK